jgi:hypothetical protein
VEGHAQQPALEAQGHDQVDVDKHGARVDERISGIKKPDGPGLLDDIPEAVGARVGRRTQQQHR